MSYPDRRPRGQTLAEAFGWFPLVPHESGCLLWPAGRIGNGYGCFRLDGSLWLAHVAAYVLTYGPVPVGLEVDHIDCVSRACANGAHLRTVTRKQNQENRHVVPGTTGIRGVSWHKASGSWTARVKHNGRTHAAYFHDIGAAERWAVAKRLELFTHNVLDQRVAV